MMPKQMPTYTGLIKKAQKMQEAAIARVNAVRAAAEAIKDRERSTIIDKCAHAMLEYDITTPELRARVKELRTKAPAAPAGKTKGKPAPKRVYKPKFRNPHTGETWHGVGRTALWMKALEAQGHKRSEFLISAPKVVKIRAVA